MFGVRALLCGCHAGHSYVETVSLEITEALGTTDRGLSL